jgi:SH3 domain-containing YSC84-like protein 1
MKTKTYDPRALFSSCFPLLAQKEEDQRLADSATVMKAILQEDNGLPKSVLNQAMCVLIFPSVKKVAIGIGAVTGAARSCAARVPR